MWCVCLNVWVCGCVKVGERNGLNVRTHVPNEEWPERGLVSSWGDELTDCASGVPRRAVFTVELYLQSERVLLFGAETEETQRDWVRAITKVTSESACVLVGAYVSACVCVCVGEFIHSR